MTLTAAIPNAWKNKMANDQCLQLLKDQLNAKNAYNY